MITPAMINKLRNQLSEAEKNNQMSVTELIEDIKVNHHVKELDMISQLLNLIKEYEKYERMDEVLRDVFGTFRHLAVDMRNHFEKEEYMAFPMMLDESVNKNELTLIIAELENEHGKTEEYISSIEKSSGYYSYRYEDTYLKLIFDKMRELFTDISEHEGKENGTLFPRFM